MDGTASQTAPARLIEELKDIPAFEEIEKEQLEWFVAQSTELRYAPGDLVFREGGPPDTMVVLLDGEVFARRESAGPDSPIYRVKKGDVTGMLPFSRMKQITVTGRAETPVRLLAFPARQFPEMLARMPRLGERLVGVMTDRVRESTRGEQQRDKLVALGKLSAGLAHELNNPAAAAARSAEALLNCVERLHALDRQPYLTQDNCGQIAATEAAIRSELRPAEFRDELELSDREEQLGNWLQQHGVEEPWQLAPVLAEANLETGHLERLEKAAGSALHPVLLRFATLQEMESIAHRLGHSTKRISSLVKAIKEYSYMDRAPVQEVDIERGLETTLTIMEHKLRKGITVTRQFAPNIPKVWANGSELNQIWTNLIDNAADAMNGRGNLRIRTAKEGQNVLVEVADDGSGIPKELQPRIFEPFFTTKDVGEGTGLGLDAVRRIVRKFNGTISFTSVPGDTRFEVRIPIHRTIP